MIMKSPDKIYVQPNAHDGWFEGDKPNDNFVEYIRKDALIEWLENKIKIPDVSFINGLTYLAVDLDEAKCYGDIILQVEYDTFKRNSKNNFIEGCWQVRVYEPIPLRDINKIEI